MNSYSVILTILIILFVCGIGVKGIVDGGYKIVTYRNNDQDADYNRKDPNVEILLFGSSYGHLMG